MAFGYDITLSPLAGTGKYKVGILPVDARFPESNPRTFSVPEPRGTHGPE